ncbi:MAG: AsmA family protein, partial [Betaproteobacteria bacterium]|nr:AsmA family protein [Betaproteobacteria bacterium]
MKILKVAAFAVGLVVLLAVVGAVVFAMSFDPNKYKPQIEAAVKEKTGRALRLEGDLKVAFFPSLGADIGKVSLSEAKSDQAFVALESAHASVAVMPLLHGQVIVDKVRVSGLKARVVKGKDGKFNFDDLLQAKEGKPPADKKAPSPSPGEGKGKVDFDLAGVAIDRSSLSYTDLSTGKELEVDDLKLSTGRVAEKASGKLELSAAVLGKNPALDLKIALGGDYDVDLPGKVYKLARLAGSAQGTVDKNALEAKLSAPRVDITPDKASGEAVSAEVSLKGPRSIQASLKIAGVEGSAKALTIPSLNAELSVSGADMPRAFKVPLSGSVKADLEKQTASADLSSKFDESSIQAKLGLAKFSPPSYQFDVSVDKLNLDQYFPDKGKSSPAPAPSGKEAKGEEKKQEEDSPIDLSPIKDLNASGRIAIGALQAKGVKLANLKAEIKAANGRLDVAPHSANLYDGSLNGVLGLQASGNHVSLKEAMTGVSIGPLLRDAAHQDRLEGKGNVSLDVSGAGATVNTLKKSLDG